MPESAQTLRIFISSPGDVAEERDRAKRVVEGLRRRYPDAILQAVLWEELALPATASFQETIDFLLEKEPIDIAVFILWSRLGSPLGTQILRSDGTAYRSGTEREFDLMLTAFEQSDGKRPLILAYVRDDDAAFKRKLAESPRSELPELFEQQQLAESFITEQFHDAEGRNIRAYQTYEEPIRFSQRLRAHLRGAIDDLVGADASATWTDEPYRGLEAFGIEHAAIFQGRDEETFDLLQRLQDQSRSGCAFVVIIGASGSGKSSLARAGVAAELMEHGFDDELLQWKVSSLIPTLSDQSLFHALVRALGNAVPDFAASDQATNRIAKGFAENASLTVELSIVPVFEQAEKPVRLLLILDQMEELWTDRETTGEDLEAFLAAIEALSRSRYVAVLATLRSDFYPHAQQSPTFLRLKGDRGHYDLLAPNSASLHRLITEPARLAGLHFESSERPGRSLDEVILQDASRNSDALPLLEYTLSELYRQRDETRQLMTFAAYVELGGVEGAIGKRADKVFASLPPEAQAALDEILPLLVSVDVAGEQAAVRRRASMADLTSTSARKILTERLIAERFLNTDREVEKPVASLAHEALLRSWDRIVNWIGRNRDKLRLRAQVEQLQQRWEQQDRDDSLLLSEGLPLDEGRQLIDETPYLLIDSTKDYIAASIAYQERRAKQSRRRRTAVMAMVAALMVVMGVVYSWQQGRAAVETLLRADPQSVLEAADKAAAYRFWTEDELQRIATSDAETRDERRHRRHARLALVAFDSTQVGPLLDDALTTGDTAYVGEIRKTLLKANAAIEEECWLRFRNGGLATSERFRAGVMLAGLAPKSEQWTESEFQLLVDEMAALNSVYQPQFWPLLQGVSDRMLPPLEVLFSNRERPESEELAAANAIAFFAEKDVERLARLLLIASGPQYNILFEKYRDVADEQTRAGFVTILQRQPSDDLDAESRIALGKERAASAITLLRLGERESILDVLRYQDDPEALTQFVHRCRARGVSVAELIKLLEIVDQRRGPLDGDRQKIDESVMYALLLALGEFDWDALPPGRETLAERIGSIYEQDPSSGVHSAAGWLLRRWDQREVVDRVDRTKLPRDPTGHREWYVGRFSYPIVDHDGPSDEQGRFYLTFIVFPPDEFTMGSPDSEPNHQFDETQHQVTLTRPIAVCDRELTWSQWDTFDGPRKRQAYGHQFSKTLGDSDPVFGVEWFDAVTYCRWLSEQAGLSEDEQCYEDPTSLPKDGEGNPTNWPLRLDNAGLRLPTEAEWELICRSGTGTAYSFGHDEELLDRYAWYLKNSGDWSHPTGEQRPNPRGLFDIHGNLSEWCHDGYSEGELSNDINPKGAGTGRSRVRRGGSWYYTAWYCRSSTRDTDEPSSRSSNLGFRLAAVPSSQVPETEDVSSGADSAGR